MKHISRAVSLTIFLLTGPCVTLAAGEQSTARPGVLTLQEAILRVFDSNPEMRASELEIRAAAGKMLQAGLRPNPELSANVQNLPALSSGNLFRTTEAEIILSQTLETGGKRSRRLSAAGKEKSLAERALELTRAELITRTRKAFTDVLIDQERSLNSWKMTDLARRSSSTVAERVQAGKASPVEETRASLALAAAELEQEKQSRELTASKDRLAALWGGTAIDFERVDAEFTIPDLPANLDACVETGPDLELAGAAVESRRAALELEQALRKPDLTVSGGYRRSNPEDYNAWVAGVSIPLPFFDKRQGSIAEARLRLEKAAAEKENTERLLRSRLSEARHSYEIARLEETALARSALPASAQVLDKTEEGYRLGKFEYLSVLDSQRTHAELQRKHIEAIASGLKAEVEIARLAGCGSSVTLPKENPK